MTTQQSLVELFGATFTDAANVAVMPILVLGAGMLLYLVCDMVNSLRVAKPLAFAGTLVAAFVAQLNIGFFSDQPPGLVLQETFIATRETALWGCLFLLGTLFAWVYSIGFYKKDAPFKSEHDFLFLAACAGMHMMVGANDLIVFFVGLELLSLPLYCLSAFRRAKLESVEAGLKYFLLGSFSSALFLYGTALLYTAAGTLSVPALVGLEHTTLSIVGVSLLAVSLFFKVSVFPFHLWVPDVYQGAPTPVTAFMATGTKAAAFAFLIRIAGILPESAIGVVAGVALVTLAVGNLAALGQSNLKRMLAYSGIAHAGTLLFLVVAVRSGVAESIVQEAALFYMLAYLAAAMGAFGVLSLLETDGERYGRIESLAGLGRTRPVLCLALGLFLLSLGGIPATGGFLGKWFVFSTLVQADMVPLAIAGALFSVIALGYYLRVIIALFMEPAPAGAAPTSMRMPAVIATGVCAALVLATGILPGIWLGLL